MEANEILSQAKAEGDAPHGWIVLPLLRQKVALGIVGWIFGAFVGFGLLALMAPLMIPHNYQIGVLGAIITTIILGMVLFVGLGSIWALLMDIQRLRQANKHVIVITPDDFVKQEGDKVIHVPLMYVRYITARGAAPPDRTAPKDSTTRQMASSGENVLGSIFGRGLIPGRGGGMRRKRMRTPTTLAFVDSRTDNEVVVVTDKSYGDHFMIAALLKQYVTSAQQIA